ncbi:hypothetical protein [Aquimarina pacifica]|uniref:hypothetical protein n=1 Tax=Aquimarina pacifica TaxID=1296415 RepID=UPI00046EBC38|nr:hypothetical protein [Aquimarina pacifica]
MKTIIVGGIFLVLSVISLFAQSTTEALNRPTPNVSFLGLFGNILANNFIGGPTVNIPIHTVHSADLKVPISLDDHIGSMKQDTQLGSIGLVWSLSKGGAITRVVNGIADENTCIEACKESVFDQHTHGFYLDNHFASLSIEDWDSSQFMFDNMVQRIATAQDSLPDDFHFDFLGYSGSFYLSPKGKWEVKSDHNFTVVFDEDNGGFLTKEDLKNIAIDDDYAFFRNDISFDEFTLIADNATQYKFGVINATEYSRPFDYTYDPLVGATSITDPRDYYRK